MVGQKEKEYSKAGHDFQRALLVTAVEQKHLYNEEFAKHPPR